MQTASYHRELRDHNVFIVKKKDRKKQLIIRVNKNKSNTITKLKTKDLKDNLYTEETNAVVRY